ncbi:MAG: 2-oxoacid:ferredoxin oxidoreductase subunit beta [Longimicrobiales bacterium]|nr:2-oxoacid:ferredoxin oxidoreductase subunit beta [Longimicrobiales bacterium]
MTHIAKPRVRHPGLPTNRLGLTRRDYEGSMSTLCAGCGHDSVTAALIEALFELDIEPHRLAKLSGIGCSAKTPTYFASTAHGFNAVHGRMPSVALGASAANRELVCVGVSGDGDSLSIGLGQLCHVIRRNLDMLYLIENNGVYGLTKGQFSASADVGSTSKRGKANRWSPIDPVYLALSLGATFVARSFSGDKEQLVPILKAGIAHGGLALVDVISPCVTFNDHRGSTKSYAYTREHDHPVVEADFVPVVPEIALSQPRGTVRDVRLHDGSVVRLRKVDEAYDSSDRTAAYQYLREREKEGEVPTGLLFLDSDAPDFHEVKETVDRPLYDLPFEELCPGSGALAEFQDSLR